MLLFLIMTAHKNNELNFTKYDKYENHRGGGRVKHFGLFLLLFFQ